MVCKRHDSNFVFADVIDNAEGELAQGETTSPISPLRAKSGILAQKREDTFELTDESLSQFRAAFASIVDGLFG
jgi:hypothetical protein